MVISLVVTKRVSLSLITYKVTKASPYFKAVALTPNARLVSIPWSLSLLLSVDHLYSKLQTLSNKALPSTIKWGMILNWALIKASSKE